MQMQPRALPVDNSANSVDKTAFPCAKLKTEPDFLKRFLKIFSKSFAQVLENKRITWSNCTHILQLYLYIY